MTDIIIVDVQYIKIIYVVNVKLIDNRVDYTVIGMEWLKVSLVVDS